MGVYELLGADGTVPEERLAFARRYEEALASYADRAFARAREILEALSADHPADVSVSRLLALARELEASPPDAGWDAVTAYYEK